MREQGEAKLMRIFIGEADRYHGKPVFEEIVRRARQQHLAGATVLRGVESFGGASLLHTAKLLRLSEDLPIIVEIVEKEERLNPFIEEIDHLFEEAECGGLITIEKVQVIRYRPGRSGT
jgi:uncharacterized protein